jgi:phosphate transport system substrate-binding protein
MLDRLHTLRAIGGKTALALVLGSTLVVAACGGTGGTGGATPTPNASLTACHVTASDIAIGGGSSATAPKTAGLSGKALKIDGSTALSPLFLDAAKSFDTVNGTSTSVTPNGSGTGLKDVEAGTVQIGLSDVYASEKAPAGQPHAYDNLVDNQVAVVPFTLAVSPDLANSIQNLTSAEILQIYTGQVTNWSQIGGPNEAITVINRPTSSGTRATFKKYVLGGQNENAPNAQTAATSAQVAQAIANGQGAIGYDTAGFVSSTQGLNPVCIDGYGATSANINSGNYKFWALEHAYTKGQPDAVSAAMLSFVTSSAFQSMDVPAKSFLSVSSLSQAAKATHPAPSGS